MLDGSETASQNGVALGGPLPLAMRQNTLAIRHCLERKQPLSVPFHRQRTTMSSITSTQGHHN